MIKSRKLGKIQRRVLRQAVERPGSGVTTVEEIRAAESLMDRKLLEPHERQVRRGHRLPLPSGGHTYDTWDVLELVPTPAGKRALNPIASDEQVEQAAAILYDLAQTEAEYAGTTPVAVLKRDLESGEFEEARLSLSKRMRYVDLWEDFDDRDIRDAYNLAIGRASNPRFNEEELANAGGPRSWGLSNAEEAADQLGDYDSVEDAYHAYLSNVEDTLNEWGFDLSTDRGHEVIGAAQKAFDERFKELTGFDRWVDNPRKLKARLLR
jgi:hypothetical protein